MFYKNYISSLLYPNNHQRGWLLKDTVKEKLYQMEVNGKGNFIQVYCNSGERLNSTPLKQKVEEFLSIAPSGKVAEDINRET